MKRAISAAEKSITMFKVHGEYEARSEYMHQKEQLHELMVMLINNNYLQYLDTAGGKGRSV